MFTGIIKELGSVEAVEASDDGARLRISAELASELGRGRLRRGQRRLPDGDLRQRGASFEADVMHQTLSLTTLGDARTRLAGQPRAAAAADGPARRPRRPGPRRRDRGRSSGLSADGFAKRLRVELPDELLPYVVEHGSIAIEGVSLTIADLAGAAVEVSLIPETLERTTLGALEPGDRVNVECDVLARYVRRQLAHRSRACHPYT